VFFLCKLTRLFSHKKALSGLLRQRSKSSWLWSGLWWHSRHRSLFGMEYAGVFLTCKPPLVYCMCFTAMGPSYSYRESKCKYHQSYSWILFSLLGKLELENDWTNVHSCQSPANHGIHYLHSFIFYFWNFCNLVCCYCCSSSHFHLWLLAVHTSSFPLL